MPLGPTAGYLARYNGTVLPGYVQSEAFDSVMNIQSHYAPYADGSLSENTGLQNKILSLTLKVWEADYISCKNEIQKAATILRSKKAGFAPLYVQYEDRYYEALTQTIRVEKTAGLSVRTLDYSVDFECRPWLIGEETLFFSGTTTIVTTGRTIDDGGWTPTNILVSGTDITISGYTDGGEFTGYATVSGSVTNLTIDSDNFLAVTGTSTNQNARMGPADYRIYVAPGVTKFDVTGASSCTVRYRNRWHI